MIWLLSLPVPRTITFESYYVRVDTEIKSDQSNPLEAEPMQPTKVEGEIRVEQHQQNSRTDSNSKLQTRAISKMEAPEIRLPWILLAVNRNARSFAQQHYDLSFEKQLGRGLYVDFKRELLLFDSCKSFKVFCGIERLQYSSKICLSEVQNLLDQLPK